MNKYLTPSDLADKATAAYGRYLKQWIRGDIETFFPYRIRAKFTVDPADMKGSIAASETLAKGAKDVVGKGYTLHRKVTQSRNLGTNPVITKIEIDTLDDLLWLAKRRQHYAATCRVATRVQNTLPALSDWLEKHVAKIHQHADVVDKLIEVTRYFLDNPWPDCYARQIPVDVETKFVEQHQPILRQWLDLLLPSSAIDVNETKFGRRFGLRDDQHFWAFRLLDESLVAELNVPFGELSFPFRTLNSLNVSRATIFILENHLNLWTLPPVDRGLGIRGQGNAVSLLGGLDWLHANRVVYWGDIDVEGFVILSRLRNYFPHVESLLMDVPTLRKCAAYSIEGTGTKPAAPSNLSPAEIQAFGHCVDYNYRLEQERIPQPIVDQAIESLTPRSG